MKKPTYMKFRELAYNEKVTRTVTISDNLLVDLDMYGGIIGIEKLDGHVNCGDYLNILKAFPFSWR